MGAMFPVRTVIFALSFAFAATVLHAQQWEMPRDARRCPSKWGAKDEIGSGNLMKPEMALKAAKLIRTGEVFSLGFHLSSSLPLIGSRRFDLHTKRSTATATVTVNPAPTAAITAPVANASLTVGVAQTVSATATAVAPATITTVQFFETPSGGASVSLGTSPGPGPYSVVWTPAAVGSYALTAVSTDSNFVTTTSTVPLPMSLPSTKP